MLHHNIQVLIRKIIQFMIVAVVYYMYRKVHLPINRGYIVVNETLIDWKYLHEEVSYPLGFGMALFEDTGQFQQLFDVMYRPFHVYCIHADVESNETVHQYARNMSKKFENVILPKKLDKKAYMGYKILKSELLCMEALLNYKNISWKYFIYLTEYDWPLKTNLELTRILRVLNGTNLVEKAKSIINKSPNQNILMIHDFSYDPNRIPRKYGPPPHGIKLWKGAHTIIVIREFVRFVLQDIRSLDLLKYLRGTIYPEETYFSTLNHDHGLKAPGGYSGSILSNFENNIYVNRYNKWQGDRSCHGIFIQYICIFSIKDVPAIIEDTNKHLFSDRFIVSKYPDAYRAMKEWFKKRDKIVYSNIRVNWYTNLTFYTQLDVVRNHN